MGGQTRTFQMSLLVYAALHLSYIFTTLYLVFILNALLSLYYGLC